MAAEAAMAAGCGSHSTRAQAQARRGRRGRHCGRLQRRARRLELEQQCSCSRWAAVRPRVASGTQCMRSACAMHREARCERSAIPVRSRPCDSLPLRPRLARVDPAPVCPDAQRGSPSHVLDTVVDRSSNVRRRARVFYEYCSYTNYSSRPSGLIRSLARTRGDRSG